MGERDSGRGRQRKDEAAGRNQRDSKPERDLTGHCYFSRRQGFTGQEIWVASRITHAPQPAGSEDLSPTIARN